jgi:hypothetical protein
VERDVWLSGRVNGSIIVQESKLQDISSFKAKNFFAANFDYVPACGFRGGIVSDWDQSLFSSLTKTIMVSLLSCISEHSLTITNNVYALSDHRDSTFSW